MDFVSLMLDGLRQNYSQTSSSFYKDLDSMRNILKFCTFALLYVMI